MASSLLYAFPTRGDRVGFVDVASYPHVGMHKHQAELAGSATRRPKPTPFVCSSSKEDNQEPTSERICESRRELIKTASMTGLSLLASSTMKSSPTWANPIMPPDVSTCTPVTITAPSGSTTIVNCCLLPPTKPIIDYQVPRNPIRHQRSPAHKVSQDYIKKYNKAYELMRNLPSTDPRSLMQQADIHCAFCNGAYDQLGSSNNKIEVHFSWIFFPWHRWYLYFHERILAKLIGDPSFSLVFWNWDNQANVGGNIMPAMFTQEGTALYDAKRNQNHLPPVLNTLNLSDISNTTLTNNQIIQDNLNIMYQSVVTASTPNLFMGQKYSAGDPEPNVGGTVEMSPHTAIHVWTGDDREANSEDMGNLYSAGRDPIFYAHHSNVDRLWTVWNRIGGRRRDHTDPDFLGATFIFYDENGQMVRVKAKDALNSSKLGVSYDDVKEDKLWLNFEPQPLSSTTASTNNIQEIAPATPTSSPVKVGKKLVRLVKRPTQVPEGDIEEVLVLENLQVPRNVATHIAVFINVPDTDEKTPLSCAEYVGSFVNVPHLVRKGMDMSSRTANVRFGITDNIKRLGIKDLSAIPVTLVAKRGGTEITLKGIKIEYE